MRLLILGATGMLGNAVVRLLARDERYELVAATRIADARDRFPANLPVRWVENVDAESADDLVGLFAATRPDVVVNCVGVVKQLADAKDVLATVPLNTLLPHRLQKLCDTSDARLVHVSTDCVFSGKAGNYRESDIPDATDVYGLSKYLGEVSGARAITMRTSIIGRELRGGHSLLEWFLAQRQPVNGFTRAVFSGLTTVELARVLRDEVLPRPELSGLYHVSADPITKYDLLKLIAAAYGRDVEILPVAEPVIDRSLNSDRFRGATGYQPPSWPELISEMRHFG